MNIFLENNAISIPHLRNDNIINLIPHLKELFIKSPLTFFSKEELNISNIKFIAPFQAFVFMDNEVVEYNLRIIDSFLPELLYAISIASNQKMTINDLILQLSKKKFPLPKPSSSKIFLTHKMIHLFEAMLFADLFDGVWNGKITTGICYVHKNNNELNYYHYYQIRLLLLELLNKITISNNYWIDNDKRYCKLLFQIEK